MKKLEKYKIVPQAKFVKFKVKDFVEIPIIRHEEDTMLGPNICNYHSILFSDDWILVKVLLYLMVMLILFVVKLLKNHSSQEMKNLLYLIRNQIDQTERYFLWFILPKIDIVDHLNLLKCWKNMYLPTIIKTVPKYVQ